MDHTITGDEDPIDPRTELGALAEFYRAFNRRDLVLMSQNWEDATETSMDNPLGGICRGWDEIRPVYERIFTGRSQVTVQFHDYSLHPLGDAFLAVGRERGALVVGSESLALKIRTSRLFVWRQTRWRQFHHHGSMDDPVLLARYQDLVRKPPAAT